MRIAFLSSLDPGDINHWSGTLYYIFRSLQLEHELEWIGGDFLEKAKQKHYSESRIHTPFIPELYSPLFAEMASDILYKHDKFDLVVARDCFFIAYLKVDIPIVYIGDTTFDLIRESWRITHDNTIRLLDDIEKRAILNTDYIIYSSQWAKENAITHYGADLSKIEVVEFGANITKVPVIEDIQIPEETLCNLLFIGKDWKRKGGDKVVETFNLLKKRNFNCTLTIIGCNPDLNNSDPDLRIIPFINKSQAEDTELFHQIMRTTHFLLFPTNFDCFGIVFCEASAYGIPSITADVGGVGQVIKEGKNGYLLSADAQAGEYASLIETLFNDKEQYHGLRESSRKEFETRLNWNTWSIKVDKILKQVGELSKGQNKNSYYSDFYIPVYTVNLKERLDRRSHIKQQFEGRREFNVDIVEGEQHPAGTIGLWQSLVKVVNMAMEREDEIIVFCEDDHLFTENYDRDFFLRNIVDAGKKGAELLSGGVSGFGMAVPVSPYLYWIDWYWGNQFLVIFQSLFQRIIDYKFKENDMADLVLSALTSKKMVIYPFISVQKEFGYSDINKPNEIPGSVVNLFTKAARRISIIHGVSHFYNYGNRKE
ncbi:glycosyltransferase family 4 protein [Proteiniphilum acetatigenes]|uniref:glycosyltransferase family 4 protein n=1 Tax=Proteiniphilum acetatigenes TaxID=294710 RepID=UPI000381BE1D|nr:glycosyltransferase family 4 protein [Proteiniphilum acetatigenes]SFL62949.1 Glycosyltransferase involved in cell wall bisynthesis [Porphyromonadaceae bacterium KH3CP3RA]